MVENLIFKLKQKLGILVERWLRLLRKIQEISFVMSGGTMEMDAEEKLNDKRRLYCRSLRFYCT